MSRIIRLAVAALVALAVVSFAGPVLLAQSQEEAPVVETKGKKARGGGPDQNIKNDSVVNAEDADIPAPPEKGGQQARGGVGLCRFHVDNRTPWYIYIYVSGNLDGVVRPWGDLHSWYTRGRLTMYGRAPFKDGSVITWGPQAAQCNVGYTWKLVR